MQLFDNNLENINFVYKVTCRKFDHLIDANKSLDQKIAGLIIFITAILGLMLPFLIDKIGYNFFTVGVFLLFFSLVILLLTSTTSNFLYSPSVNTIYSAEALARNNIDLKNQVIADTIYCFNENIKIQNKKAEWFNSSLFFFIISLTIIFFGFLM